MHQNNHVYSWRIILHFFFLESVLNITGIFKCFSWPIIRENSQDLSCILFLTLLYRENSQDLSCITSNIWIEIHTIKCCLTIYRLDDNIESRSVSQFDLYKSPKLIGHTNFQTMVNLKADPEYLQRSGLTVRSDLRRAWHGSHRFLENAEHLGRS